MKKYGWLAGITLAVLLGILAVTGTILNKTPTVRVTQLQTQHVEQTVQCSGKVEEADRAVQAVIAAGSTAVQVRVAVPEGRLRLVQVGQRVKVTGAAFSADSYTGTVVSIGDKAYTTIAGSTVVDAVIALDNADRSLKCGLTAKAGICVSSVDGLLAPYTAVCADESGQEYVYVLQNGRAVRRNVTTAEELTEGVCVAAGLQAGDWLIVDPEKVSADGMRVQTEDKNG